MSTKRRGKSTQPAKRATKGNGPAAVATGHGSAPVLHDSPHLPPELEATLSHDTSSEHDTPSAVLVQPAAVTPEPPQPVAARPAAARKRSARPSLTAALKATESKMADVAPPAPTPPPVETPRPAQTEPKSEAAPSVPLVAPQPPVESVAVSSPEPAKVEPKVQASAPPSEAAAKPDAPPRAAAPPPKSDAKTAASAISMPDLEALTRNMGKLIEYSGQAAAAYLKPRETGEVKSGVGDEVMDTFKTIGKVAESWFVNPAKAFQAQAALSTQLFGAWTDSLSRMGGGGVPAPNAPPPRKVDKRFAAPEWKGTPMFDFLHQAYLVTTDWAKTMVDDAEGVDEATREKAAFYLRQISSAMSPANFLATNPELIRETFKENGENLVRGMRMLAEDIAAGGGDLKIRQSDPTKFKLGVDMASTPGKVVFRNELIELLQYAPSTPAVLKRPILIVPPWINKFYVLDLNKEKSFVRWMVSQGLTVFVISWVNPDARHATKDWESYMQEGIFAALDAVKAAIGVEEVSTIGYCVGGTLLAATLAYMAGKGDQRIGSSTFLTTQVDFKEAGDLKVFADEAQIRVLEKEMKTGGFLPGSKMASAFNMLRPDDLIWSYAINTYLKGQPPAPFDLLAWNSDSTRMSAANHAFYLRNCYLENKLTAGEMVIGGERLNMKAVTVPIYDLATKEDHIAPARSVFTGAKYFGGPVRYVLAGSGHIAGVVNPPARAKYGYWSDGDLSGTFEGWLASATEHKGTWWLDWVDWIRAQAPETVPARDPSQGGLPALGDAPGEYVRVMS